MSGLLGDEWTSLMERMDSGELDGNELNDDVSIVIEIGSGLSS